jgi:hypothetical protein
MERKFMVYQRRDGFQVAEEATGTRMKNGMDFLARPHKSANWCAAAFNIVIDDDYELVGEEVIDCSIGPAQVLCFIDGVMKTYDAITIAHAEALDMNPKLIASDTWQTKGRGSNDQEYQIYLSCADDGKGNEFMTGKPLKTYEEWVSC